ncbi:MAG: cyclic nucleotide-binding domain-containing protein [Spirochaetaceae bacterium]|nr:MAG: cyclic nucleotide-binding domain-containing protein [Spirochaetaceae bacterium]
MPYRLKDGIYAVRCRYPRCTFHSQFEIKQNIMGMTEKDVEIEAKRIARDMSLIKHDAIHATRHTLRNPEIRKVSGSYELIGPTPRHGEDSAYSAQEREDVYYKEYQRGEVILRKGDDATSVCEVVRGSAYPERNRSHRYRQGDCFGAAALLARRQRTCDVVAGSDGTKVAFYNLIELSKSNPKKARELFSAVMEDTFRVIQGLEKSIDRTKKDIEREVVRG